MRLDRGPSVGHRRLSTSATRCTACGLPIDSTATSHLPAVAQVQRPQLEAALARGCAGPGVEGHAAVEHRRVHVHRDAAVGLQVQLQQVVDGLARARVRLVGQAAVVHVAHEAARAVAAVLDLVAAVVEDAVAEVHARRAGLGSTTRIWSAPTPKRRSPRWRNCAGVSASGARVASSTTKSLPAPCILVKRSRIARIIRPQGLGRRSRRARLAGRPRLEALVHPQVLRRAAADLGLDEAVHARASASGRRWASRSRAAGSARGSPGRRAASRPPPAAPPCSAARHARRRQQRGRRHAEEGHEGRVAQAEVHVGQVEEGVALADGAHQRRAPSLRVKNRRAEAQRGRAQQAASNTALLCGW
jgi:hypothetical protein